MTASKRVNPAYKVWKAKRDKLARVLEKVKTEPSPHGDKWTRKMVYHYQSRLDMLDTKKPPYLI